MKNEIYFVGGCVRDKLLGIKSNDIDFTFVVNDLGLNLNPREGFLIMGEYLKKNDFKIFLSTPEMFTVRAKFPKNHKFEGLVADFVLARKEISFTGADFVSEEYPLLRKTTSKSDKPLPNIVILVLEL
jgi:tRNA nucleotidyltransferase/poly(A) polymerase